MTTHPRNRRFALATTVVVAGLVMTAGATVASAAAPPDASPALSTSLSAPPAGCLVLNDQGRQSWAGEPSAELDAMSDELSVLRDSHRDEINEVSLCSDYSGSIVFAKTLSESTETDIDRVTAEYPDYPVYVEWVPNSADDVEAVYRVLRENHDWMHQLVSVFGPNSVTGGLHIDLLPQSDSEAFARAADEVRRDAEALVGTSVPFDFGEMAPIRSQPGTRGAA